MLGVTADQVEASWKPKSLLSMKSFSPPLMSTNKFDVWLNLLCTELCERIKDDKTMCNRHPKTMVVHLRGVNTPEVTLRQPMPRSCTVVESLIKAINDLCSKVSTLPTTRLGISAENFEDLPEHNLSIQLQIFLQQQLHLDLQKQIFNPHHLRKKEGRVRRVCLVD